MYPGFADDVKLCKRTMIGSALSLAAMPACAIGYALLYGTNDHPMTAYLSRWTLTFGGFFLPAGVIGAFAVHIIREWESKRRKS